MFNLYILIGLLVGGILSHGATAYISYGKGKKAERAIWNEANIEVLAASNVSLAGLLSSQEKEMERLRGIEVEAGNKASKVETRIIERIKEVPVERIVEVGGDCRLNYSIIGLRNNWASGDNIAQEHGTKTTRDISGDKP